MAQAASPERPRSPEGRGAASAGGRGCGPGRREWGRAWHGDAGQSGRVSARSAAGVSAGPQRMHPGRPPGAAYVPGPGMQSQPGRVDC